ncbi:hypothetical protein EDB83DRAFT_2580024 [Lactarius deliciosus]|nr:hypothetical protein EDB83DRAFT_2580024 [Lactarius deliciosus]
MNYPPTINDPYAFPVWPDSEAVASEELMAWARATGCAQSGPSMENVYFDDLLDTTALASGLSRTMPDEPFGVQNDAGMNWTSGGVITTDILNHDIPLPDATVTTTTSTIVPATMPPLPTDNTDAFIQGFFFTQPDFSTSFGTPSLTDISSLPSPQSDDTGGGVLQFPPTFEVASSYLAQPPGLAFPQLNTAGAMSPNQVAGAPPTWIMGGSNFAVPVQSDYGPIPDPVMTNSRPLIYTQLIDYLTTPADALVAPAMRETVSAPSLGKRSRQRTAAKVNQPARRRGEGPAQPGSPRERSPRNGLVVPLPRGPDNISIVYPKQRDAERRGPRPRRRREYTTDLCRDLVSRRGRWEPLSRNGCLGSRREVEARRDTGSPVPLQSVENADDGEGLHKIPEKLTERERLMLQTTQVDEERGAVRVIKCRVCPEREFGGWLTFRRHCNSCEKHPSALKFCSKCGDYFGRPDSEDRHKGKKYQGACLSTSQDEAKQKEQKVGRLLKAFEARLKHCLRTGEEIRPLFSNVVTKKLTNTSKKVSKREETWVEGNSWADGL